MITKKITPIGNVWLNGNGKYEMKISSMVTEYRFFGILFYKKELITPYYFLADYYEGFYIKY